MQIKDFCAVPQSSDPKLFASAFSVGLMKFEETVDGNSAFAAYPFDLSAVCLNVKKPAQWRPVSRFMAPAPGASDRENRAVLPSSSPPSGGKRTRSNWPPSIRREEANVFNSLRKRLGHSRVRNTSTFKNVSALRPDADGATETSDSTERTLNPADLANMILLRKMLSNRSFNRLSNNRDTDTDWYTSDFVVECLCWHNVYRQRHRSPPLSLSPELCHYAQEWANTLAHMNLFFYRPNQAQDVGQNVYCRLNVKDPGDVTGQEVAGFWYGACKKYDFLKDPELLHANPNAGHFTQLVWASSRDIGIGIARSRSGKVMVVANYRPRGNVTGQFGKNVLLPALDCKTTDCTDCCTFPIPR